MLMKDEKANLYIAQQRRANLPQGSFKFSVICTIIFIGITQKCARLFLNILMLAYTVPVCPSDRMFPALH